MAISPQFGVPGQYIFSSFSSFFSHIFINRFIDVIDGFLLLYCAIIDVLCQEETRRVVSTRR